MLAGILSSLVAAGIIALFSAFVREHGLGDAIKVVLAFPLALAIGAAIALFFLSFFPTGIGEDTWFLIFLGVGIVVVFTIITFGVISAARQGFLIPYIIGAIFGLGVLAYIAFQLSQYFLSS